MKAITLTLWFLALCSITYGQTDQKSSSGDRIEILNANTLEYEETSTSKVKKLIGDVALKQQDVLMNCDSAYLYEDQNLVEAYSRVVINQNDSVLLRGDFLRYEGDIRKAYITDNVTLDDGQMHLTTSQLDYDVAQRIGYYTQSAVIVNEENTLTSQLGTYYANAKTFSFKQDVKLTNPDYIILSDTLQYNSATKVAYFFGPTTISGKEDTIYCENGWYDTEREVSQFSQNATITTPDNILKSDSLYYNRAQGFGKAFRNIRVIDPKEQLLITGQYGYYDKIARSTFVTQDALAKKLMDADSLFIRADTLFSLQDSSGSGRLLKAYHTVKVFKPDMQAVCDSMLYDFADSSITLFQDPILWSDENQLTADTMIIYTSKNQVDSIDMIEDAFIASLEIDPHYNQIKGIDMRGYFRDGSIHQVDVFGNGESVYYAEEDSSYIGVNKIVCSDMIIRLVNSKVDNISFITAPDAEFLPVDALSPAQLKLEGFRWFDKLRPHSLDEL